MTINKTVKPGEVILHNSTQTKWKIIERDPINEILRILDGYLPAAVYKLRQENGDREISAIAMGLSAGSFRITPRVKPRISAKNWKILQEVR